LKSKEKTSKQTQKKKRLTKMIDVYKHALIGGNGVPYFGPKV
jgi:hypothetical protein